MLYVFCEFFDIIEVYLYTEAILKQNSENKEDEFR